jgi:hypothetical protein
MMPRDGSAELLALPFPPGEAPFRVKGTAYRGHLEYVEDEVRGGVEAMLDELGDEEMRRFFGQPFLAASLYDVFPLALAGAACGRLTNRSYLDFVRIRAEAQAARDVSGVYRVLLALASPDAVATRLPKLVGQYFDFGETEIVEKGSGVMVATFTGMPAPLAPWYATVSEAYLRVVLARAGASNPRTELTEVEPSGARAGVDLVDLLMTTHWE